jgi:hypothetical protein
MAIDRHHAGTDQRRFHKESALATIQATKSTKDTYRQEGPTPALPEIGTNSQFLVLFIK